MQDYPDIPIQKFEFPATIRLVRVFLASVRINERKEEGAPEEEEKEGEGEREIERKKKKRGQKREKPYNSMLTNSHFYLNI